MFAVAPATLALLALNVLLSGLALFAAPRIIERNVLKPYSLVRDKRYDTLITNGFIHADFSHLFFNMLTLYFFGPYLEATIGTTSFVALYFIGLLVSSLGTFLRRRKDPNYASLGASGAINTVLFAYIVYYPTQMLYLFFAVPIPAAFYAVGYLVYSWWSSRQARGGINHDAHIDGAIVGLLFVAVTDIDAWPRALAEIAASLS